MKHLHTFAIGATLLCGASILAPAQAQPASLPTGNITSNSFDLDTTGQYPVLDVIVKCNVTNSALYATYAEINDKMTYALTPAWNLSYFFPAAGNNLTTYKVTKFGTLPTIHGMPGTSDARLAVSYDAPDTGGTAYVLDTNSQELHY